MVTSLKSKTIKPFLYCPKCHQPFHYRLPTPFLVKTLFFFMPVKRFFCAKCNTPRYKIMSSKDASKYHI
jgi:RNase P subunit RPR2